MYEANLETYTWKTEFITAGSIMIHTFNDRIKVVTNLKTGDVKILRDGKEIDRRANMFPLEYEKFLLMVAQAAIKLI